MLVTRDLDFPIPAALGRPPGLVILRPGPNARSVQIEHLVRTLVEQVDLATLTGAVTILEPGRCRQRPYDKLSWSRAADPRADSRDPLAEGVP